jgi:hypothetical protein
MLKLLVGQMAEPFGMTSILKYIMTEEVTDEYKTSLGKRNI